MKHSRLLVFLLLLILVLAILFPEFQKHPLYTLMRPFVFVISSLQEGMLAVGEGIGNVWSDYISLTDVRKENARLREEVLSLRNENVRLLENQSAMKRMEDLLRFKVQAAFPMVAARVIGRDPTNWYRTLVIDKGENDGVRVDMGVIVPAGVIGRIVKTNDDIAYVLLLTDRSSAITALVQRTRDEGIVEGTESGLARIKYIPALAEIQGGDIVITSGLVGSFPKGLPVGRIRRVEKHDMAMFQEAEMVPEVDLSRLEEVMVITGPGKNRFETGEALP
jgi:rod shape-determining protein MreC